MFIEFAISLFEQKSQFLVQSYGGDCNIGKNVILTLCYSISEFGCSKPVGIKQ